MKPVQLRPSELTKDTQEKELGREREAQPMPLEQRAGLLMATREIHIDDIDMARKLLEDLQAQPN